MNNQTIKNMELILLEIRKNVMTKGSDTRAPKTLIHSYLTMLKEIERSGRGVKEPVYAAQLGVQADQLRIIQMYVKEDKMQELFNASDYIGINNYATVLDKVGQALDTIGEPKRSFYTSMTLIEELLEKSIQTGTLVTFYDETHRGMGKTTALVKKANELDAVLITGVKSQAKYAHEIAEDMGLYISATTVRDANSLPQYRQKIKESGFLVDELVEKDDLKHLRNYKLLGGFTRIVI